MVGNHTVRRSSKQWAGIWTDLSIEQILVKSLKGKRGVIGRGITENVLYVRTKTMHRCAEVTNARNIVSFLSNSEVKHEETFASRVKRDSDDFEKVLTWFRAHNPFELGPNLIALASGLVDDKNCLNCGRAEEIGTGIQALQSLHSNVKINEEDVVIDPLTLLLRLVVVVEKRRESEIAD